MKELSLFKSIAFMTSVALFALSASASLINVPLDYPTIQQAIDASSDADEIIVIDKGELIEHGTHEQLIRKKNLYYQLYQQQSDPELIKQSAE